MAGWTLVPEQPQQASAQGWTPVDEGQPQPQPMSASERDTRPLAERLKNGSNPGSFEGNPENVGHYVSASAGEVLGGAHDILQGNFAKGLHRIIGGIGNATLPAAPFAAAAAP